MCDLKMINVKYYIPSDDKISALIVEVCHFSVNKVKQKKNDALMIILFKTLFRKNNAKLGRLNHL